MTDFSSSRYLHSKTSVDDRALNRTVLEELKKQLKASEATRPAVLEIGCGVGTMLTRLTQWGVLGDADYTFVDLDCELLVSAREHLLKLPEIAVDGDALCYRHAQGEIRLTFEHADILEYAQRPAVQAKFDLVLANAVLDLLEVAPALLQIWRCMRPKASYWFTINFDGDTIFVPDAPLDDAVMRAYHRTMDERVRDGKPSGDSRSGRHLLTLLPASGATLNAAGSSDWVVFPTGGQYPADEQHFIGHILHTIETALTGDAALDAADFSDWLALRKKQLEDGTLCYVAHQIDVAGCAP